jgi:hypothetical protein
MIQLLRHQSSCLSSLFERRAACESGKLQEILS